MHRKEVRIESFKFLDNARLQCMHGCIHYRRNPMCPPSCRDDIWFRQLFARYDKATVCYETVTFRDNADLTLQRNVFNLNLIKLEHQLKKEGNYFALAFISGGCTLCEEKVCTLVECTRVNSGRTPVCALGIDMQHLGEQVLSLAKQDALSFWKANLSRSLFDPSSKGYLCLGLLVY